VTKNPLGLSTSPSLLIAKGKVLALEDSQSISIPSQSTPVSVLKVLNPSNIYWSERESNPLGGAPWQPSPPEEAITIIPRAEISFNSW
jgi:hypothetical protein